METSYAIIAHNLWKSCFLTKINKQRYSKWRNKSNYEQRLPELEGTQATDFHSSK